MKRDNHVTQDFLTLLQDSAKIHGHNCPGQVLGIKMAMRGLKEIGITDPKGTEKKHLIVFVEMDRCATDAIQSVTGCSLGRRTLKFMDYGKMAATFVNVRTGKAVRIVARDDARETAKNYGSGTEDKYAEQRKAYEIMPDEELFTIMQVTVNLKQEDMPGRPLSRIQCDECGELVQDMREIHRDGQVLCRPCADGGYYEIIPKEPMPVRLPVPVGRKKKTPGDFF